MRRNSPRRLLVLVLIALFLATFLVVAIAFKPPPVIIWNTSNSVPVGWYWVEKRQPEVSEIAVVRPPDWVRLYMSSRSYLPDDVWLLKPIFATSGATVCRFGPRIFVDGNLVARARKFDRQERTLPRWHGCQTIRSDEVFLLAKPKNSFDSRYFGLVKRDHIVGTAKRLRFPFSELQ